VLNRGLLLPLGVDNSILVHGGIVIHHKFFLFQADAGTDIAVFIDAVSEDLSRRLPPQWSLNVANGGLHLLLFSSDEGKVVQRSIFISGKGKISSYVHGCKLPKDHEFFRGLDHESLRFSGASDLAKKLLHILAKFRLFEICTGVDSEKYRHLWRKTPDSFVAKNQFREARYDHTIRSDDCAWIVTQPKRRCDGCSKMFNKYFKNAKCAVPEEELKTPSKFKPYSHLNSGEKKRRQARSSKDIKNLRRQIARLKEKLREKIEVEGVNVDEEFDKAIREDLNSDAAKSKMSPFMKIF